jgi:hypothetical protein
MSTTKNSKKRLRKFQELRKTKNSNFPIKTWSKEEDNRLLKLSKSNKYKTWLEISRMMTGRTPGQCADRWKQIQQERQNKGPWTEKEDIKLTNWVKTHNPIRWNECSLYMGNRSGKQCREHWNNCLNPNLVKGNWTSEEDFLIMYLYQKLNGSWAKIIDAFPGRTENSIKNRFFSQLRKIASRDSTSIEEPSKIKKDELEQKYFNKVYNSTKTNFMKEKDINEKGLENYLEKIEQKMKEKKSKDKNIIKEELETFSETEIKISEKEKEIQNFLEKKRENEQEIESNFFTDDIIPFCKEQAKEKNDDEIINSFCKSESNTDKKNNINNNSIIELNEDSLTLNTSISDNEKENNNKNKINISPFSKMNSNEVMKNINNNYYLESTNLFPPIL